jgi:hypothetical protein
MTGDGVVFDKSAALWTVRVGDFDTARLTTLKVTDAYYPSYRAAGGR